MESKGESVSKIIEKNTSESLVEPNLSGSIQLAERIKTNRKEAKEAATKLAQIFKTEKYKRTYLALQMLEVLSKNGSLEFHEYLSQEDFMKEYLRWLKIMRGKGGLFSGFETKSKKELREKIQDQALYLLQLWADAFMMYQDQYPGFQKYYRELRAEGIQFPQRDINERTMMENLEGITSPMFDFVEQAEKKSKKKSDKESRKSKTSTGKKSINKEDEKEEEIDDTTPTLQAGIKAYEEKIEAINNKINYVEEPLADIEEIENYNYSKYEKESIDKSEFDIAKSNINILENMASNCETFNDYWTNVIMELYQTAMKSAIKIHKIIEIRKKAKVGGDKDIELIETVHEIQGKIESFRKRYLKLKKKEIQNLENQKRVLTKQLRKQEKLKRKEERRKRKEEKIKKQKEERNPFDVMDETEGVIERPGEILQEQIVTSDHEESSESSSDNTFDKPNNADDNDSESSDDLHQPISMWSILYNDLMKGKNKDKKKKEKEKEKQKQKENKEKARVSQLQPNKEPSKGGFLRNSVLVQKTINFFGRKSKPLLNASSEEEDNNIGEKENKRSSNMKPELNDYFVQTSSKAEIEKREDSEEKVNKEIEVDFFKNNEEDKNDSEEENKEEKIETKKQDKPPIFPYKSKVKCDIPMHKSKSKANRDSDNIKRIVAPPRSSNLRKSVVSKPDLLNLIEDEA